MVKRVVATMLIGAALVFLLPVAQHSGAEEAAFDSFVDRYGIDLVAYATVRRSDGTYRRMLTQPGTLAAAATGEPLPEGARIFMESYYRPGQVSTVFHMQKTDGRWAYGSFSAARPDLATRPQASCLSCHAGAAATDLVYTLPSLRATGRGLGESDFSCDRGGRSPCDAEVYRRGPES